MKHLSIKKRVTIWYAIMLVVLLSGIILALFAIDDRLAHENLKSSLRQTVDQSLSDVKITNGVLTIDQNIDTYIDGKSIIVTRENGFLVGPSRRCRPSALVGPLRLSRPANPARLSRRCCPSALVGLSRRCRLSVTAS